MLKKNNKTLMANILEYTLTLKDLVSAKLQKIGVTNDTMLDKFGELQATQAKVTKGFGNFCLCQL